MARQGNFQYPAPSGKGGGYEGMHEELNPIMGMAKEVGLVHTDSLEITNDPRFFRKSVLNKRLMAFSSLSVVSGLMVGTSTAVISMKKDINLVSFEGQLQLLSFGIMTMVLFSNIVATYVGVAQVYHTYRLETSGPTGFEMATSYYLNPNIVSWRHIAIKAMLHSLPMFLVSTGIRIQVSFDNAVEKFQPPSFWVARFLGLFFMGLYFVMAAILYYLHWKHTEVFRERYSLMQAHTEPYLTQVRQQMSGRGRNMPLDV